MSSELWTASQDVLKQATFLGCLLELLSRSGSDFSGAPVHCDHYPEPPGCRSVVYSLLRIHACCLVTRPRHRTWINDGDTEGHDADVTLSTSPDFAHGQDVERRQEVDGSKDPPPAPECSGWLTAAQCWAVAAADCTASPGTFHPVCAGCDLVRGPAQMEPTRGTTSLTITYTHARACAHTHTHARMHAHTQAHRPKRTHTHTHTDPNTHTHAHPHTAKYTCTQAPT